MKRIRIAIFASGSGTNAAKIMDYFHTHPEIEVALVVCNQPLAGVCQLAQQRSIPVQLFTNDEIANGEKVVSTLKSQAISWIVLAGFLRKIPDQLVAAYADHIINIHPALLPKFGGKGMYGMHVHRAVKAAGEKESGISIHLVNEHFDEGRILAQFSTLIAETDTPEMIAAKVQELEHRYFSTIIEETIRNAH